MSDSYFAQSRLLWKPDHPEWTSIEILKRAINRKHGLNLEDYHELHAYSVTKPQDFWVDLWEHLGIISSVPFNQVTVPGAVPEIPIWFPGARLNYAENLLSRNDDGIACTTCSETGRTADYSFKDLRRMVKEMAAALRAQGLTAGDRVAAIVVNSIQAVVVCLAAASLGAIFSTTAPDLGKQGILDRYRQIQPKFIFAESQVLYAGKTLDLCEKVAEIVQDLQSHGLQLTIMLPSAVTGKPCPFEVPNAQTLEKFLASGDNGELTFQQLPFSHPLCILYSSGTSGPPKCIVHSAGGVLMQCKKDILLSYDLRPNESYLQFTTTAWMMFLFSLHGLSCGARLVLYDGSPFHPDVRTYLKLISDLGVSVLGTSPRFLAEVHGRKIEPLQVASFKSLRLVMVTGAVLTPNLFSWAQKAFGEIGLISASGGTDICSVGGAANLNLYSGEIQAKALGMKVEILDELGRQVEDGIAGELTCALPHPSLPLKFWGDSPDRKRLLDTYWSTYGRWKQGDWMVINPVTKGILILGRSDGVLNPSGVRFGSGEIYTVLEQFAYCLDDFICVGQRRPQDVDERVLLFLKLHPGYQLTPELQNKIRSAIRRDLSARHLPAFIDQVEEIPYTVNGKKIEIAVKQIVSGTTLLKPSGTVANPQSLELYKKYQDIESCMNLNRVTVKL
ncbi:acetoacetyl-CoA synthetase [Mycena floridula]|nr:acetoacetyl-CoA synthetase [Mycena floridula]